MTPTHYQYFILAQYVCLSCWHAACRNWPQAGYWMSAAGITASVTLGMGKH